MDREHGVEPRARAEGAAQPVAGDDARVVDPSLAAVPRQLGARSHADRVPGPLRIRRARSRRRLLAPTPEELTRRPGALRAWPPRNPPTRTDPNTMAFKPIATTRSAT